MQEREKAERGLAYILFNLDAFPPEIFCTLNWPSSVFSSRSCFWRSSFDLPHNWTVLILVVFDCQPPHHTTPQIRVSQRSLFQRFQSFSFHFFLPYLPYLSSRGLYVILLGLLHNTRALSGGARFRYFVLFSLVVRVGLQNILSRLCGRYQR